MKLLHERILAEGENLGRGILKIDSFLNHQVDADLMEAVGEVIGAAFESSRPTRILTAEVKFWDGRVRYDSPSLGLIEFGWKGSLRHRGRQVSLEDYPRYGNPYVQAGFPSEQIEISLGEHRLHLDWIAGKRQASDFIA